MPTLPVNELLGAYFQDQKAMLQEGFPITSLVVFGHSSVYRTRCDFLLIRRTVDAGPCPGGMRDGIKLSRRN
jgi:hypothetical protein